MSEENVLDGEKERHFQLLLLEQDEDGVDLVASEESQIDDIDSRKKAEDWLRCFLVDDVDSVSDGNVEQLHSDFIVPHTESTWSPDRTSVGSPLSPQEQNRPQEQEEEWEKDCYLFQRTYSELLNLEGESVPDFVKLRGDSWNDQTQFGTALCLGLGNDNKILTKLCNDPTYTITKFSCEFSSQSVPNERADDRDERVPRECMLGWLQNQWPTNLINDTFEVIERRSSKFRFKDAVKKLKRNPETKLELVAGCSAILRIWRDLYENEASQLGVRQPTKENIQQYFNSVKWLLWAKPIRETICQAMQHCGQ